MLLKELLKDIYAGPFPRGPRGSSPRPKAPRGEGTFGLWEEYSRRITAIGCDSRTTEQDSLFVALKGTKHDGAQFIDEAIKKGARVVASSHPPTEKRADVLFLHVDRSEEHTSELQS